MYFGPILRHFRVKLGVWFGNLRFCWAYIGPLRAYVRPYNILGQLEGFISGSSWGFCLAIYDFVGLILGHFRPMLGPATYWVSWRAICWAYLGPSGHIGSFQGYVGPVRHFRVKLGVLFGNLRFCWAYIGPLRAYVRPYNILGQLEGYMNEPCVTLCPLADSLSVFFRTGLQALSADEESAGQRLEWSIWIWKTLNERCFKVSSRVGHTNLLSVGAAQASSMDLKFALYFFCMQRGCGHWCKWGLCSFTLNFNCIV